MQNVINTPSKADAISQAARFLQYYPYRYAGIVELQSGVFGWFNGKTRATANRLARAGLKVSLLSR